MANIISDKSADWNFSGSHAAKKASEVSLSTYTSKLFGMCDPKKPILPPIAETALAQKVAEIAVVKAVEKGTGNAYAPNIGLPAARSAVADYLNLDGLTKNLTVDDVFMTSGCKQAIELAVDILAKPDVKVNVLLPSPGFPWEVVRSTFKKVEIRTYEFLPEQKFEIDLASAKKKVDKNTFAIFLINPHNPNGNTYSAAHLKQIADFAKDSKIMVVSDEVFRWTVFGSNPFVPMARFSDIVPVITLGSISKGWSVPGWRTGWIALHDPHSVLEKTRIFTSAIEFLGLNSKPPTVIQAAIPAILKDTPEDFFTNRQHFLSKNADYAFSRVDDIDSLTCYMKPEACTFIWTKLDLESFMDIKDDETFCEKLAKEENLILLPGVAFGLSGWARHSIDMDHSTLEDAFDYLESFCDRHLKSSSTADED